jgi:pSer/pThr/pTyr-binding forkhead associated (FHA) protein
MKACSYGHWCTFHPVAMSRLLASSLGVVCPTCDVLGPPGSLRCEACGTPFVQGLAAPRPPPAPEEAPPAPVQPAAVVQEPPAPAPPAAPSAQRAAPPTAPVASRFILGVVSGPGRGQRFRLMANGCTIGRSRGAILFPDDVHVSAHHAAFRIKEGQLTVKDEASVSGVFATIRAPEVVPPGGTFVIGQRLLRFQGLLTPPTPDPKKPRVYGVPLPPQGVMWALEELLVGGRPGRAVATAQPLLTLGLAGCDVNFPGEPGLAPRHCELTASSRGGLLRDLSAGLGTFIRIGPQERLLQAGDRVRIGDQVLLVEVT